MIYDEILSNLSRIVESNASCKEVYSTFKLAELKIGSRDVLLKTEPKMTRMLSGSAFGRDNNTGEIYIYFGQKYLDTYSRNSSIHHTILIHEMKHLYDCFSNGNDFFNSTEKEKYFFEFEARAIEAKFIENYLVDHFEITRLEGMLLDSYHNNDLNEFITLFQRVDKNVYVIFRGLEEDFQNHKLTRDEIVETIISGAMQLMNRFGTSSNDNAKFSSYVSIKSFRNCLEDVRLSCTDHQIDFKYLMDLDDGRLRDIYSKLYYVLDNYEPIYRKHADSLDILLEDQYIKHNYTPPNSC